MFSIGLTGGIGCGKSAAAQAFADLGVPVLDADQIARELVTPGSPALAEIVAAFGPGTLTREGTLDRRALRERVFADPSARKRLEGILHPRVRHELISRRAQLQGPYCVLVIPLLFEAGLEGLVDRVLVVDCSEAQQRSRVAARDGVPPAQVEAIMKSQVSRSTRLARADDVLDNAGPPGRLSAQVAALHARYLRLASAADA